MPFSASTPSSSEVESEMLCTHCQLPVPPGLADVHSTEQFCCNGCKTVFHLLKHEGLTDFYRLCSEWKSRPNTAPESLQVFEEMDDTKFQEKYVRPLGNSQWQTTLILEGIHCAACIWLLEKLPIILPGVIEARAQMLQGTVIIRWNGDQLKLSQIASRIHQLGYTPHAYTPDQFEEITRRENRAHLLRLGIAGFCTANSMMLAFGLYGAVFDIIAEEHFTMLRMASMFFGILALLWPGSVFFRGAWRAMKNRTPHMDISLTLGLSAGGILSIANTLSGTGEIYFDSLSMLIFVLLIGRYMQYRQQRQAARSVSLLRSLTPQHTYRVESDSSQPMSVGGEYIKRIPLEALKINDLIELSPGHLIPADGIVEQGRSTIDQSLLTGESQPISVSPGDGVLAGTMNVSHLLRVRVKTINSETRIGQLSQLMESASLAKVPIVELANRVSGYFLYLVLSLAVLTLALWWKNSSRLATEHTIALLIVACPCALGLATPLTIAIAQGRAARKKILIRSGEVLELANRKCLIWLDKTGTITEGKPALKEWFGDSSSKLAVLALEQKIVHPLAQNLVIHLSKMLHYPELPQVSDLQYVPGQGVSGNIDGNDWRIGTRLYLQNHDISLDQEVHWPIQNIIHEGNTPLYIACNHRLVALAVMGDSLRPESRHIIEQLQALGSQVGLLSGDHPGIVEKVGSSLGLSKNCIIGGATPERKLEIVRSTSPDIPVIMVGDGINDAAALVAASVGVAVHGGAEVSLKAANVYLGKPGLGSLLELFDGSRQTMRALRNGIIMSIGYNLLAITLAICGYVTPLLAAILMPISSISVVALSILQPTFRSRV